MHVILAPDGHGVGLTPQVLEIVVHVVCVPTQPGEVVDLDGGVGVRGPSWLSSGVTGPHQGYGQAAFPPGELHGQGCSICPGNPEGSPLG